jgi:hypothetical protein
MLAHTTEPRRYSRRVRNDTPGGCRRCTPSEARRHVRYPSDGHYALEQRFTEEIQGWEFAVQEARVCRRVHGQQFTVQGGKSKSDLMLQAYSTTR